MTRQITIKLNEKRYKQLLKIIEYEEFGGTSRSFSETVGKIIFEKIRRVQANHNRINHSEIKASEAEAKDKYIEFTRFTQDFNQFVKNGIDAY